jgi:hypothetical protein
LNVIVDGNSLVDHTTQDDAPGRLFLMFLAISSIFTTALPPAS